MRHFFFAVAMMAFLGCAHQPGSSTQPTAGMAECAVCKQHGDMACLNVAVTPTTPQTLYMGRVRYFCSEECKASFLKNPDKFVDCCGK